MVLRSALLAGTAALVLGGLAMPTLAADLPPGGYYQQPAYNPPADWTGFYLGAMLGYNWGEFDTDANTDVDVDGLMIGGFTGYNWQAGALVFGLEADLAMSSADGSENSIQGDVDWQGTLRGRVGYTFDRHMIYGTAGLAFASGDLNSDDNTHTGLAAGVGFESMLNQSLSARVEYLYTNYNEQDYRNIDSDLGVHAVRGGVGYHF